MREPEKRDIDMVRHSHKSMPSVRRGNGKTMPTLSHGLPRPTQQNQKVCRKDHPPGRDHCPARLANCNRCGKPGHYMSRNPRSCSIN